MKRTNDNTRELIYQFVRERLLRGDPPSVREVQAALGFRATQSAQEHLDGLVEEGRLIRLPGRSRGYRLPSENPPAFVPLVGRVHAGPLTTAFEEIEGYLPVQTRKSSSELFALRVRGDSMIDAGILHGDVIIVRKQTTANSGEIIVALVGDEATVKRLRIHGDVIELCPENHTMFPIIVDSEDLRILGKIIEVRRYLESSHSAAGEE
ncbi:MAG: repressor LexA [Myxococcales bacterium]|nr:repressor LexA [Myxococcales bacterium]